MKNIILFAMFAISINANAQIILEQTYDSASTNGANIDNQLMIINFEVSGEKYVKINRWGKYINIYDLNHSLVKTIDCSSFPLNGGVNMGDIIYLSEHLFDTDDGIEFMYGYYYNNNYCTNIYNDDGSLLFSEYGAPWVRVNTPQQQLPIFNTSQGTKMILSYPTGEAKVFSLPGHLNTSIAEANGQLLQTQNGQLSNLYPNPSNGAVTLQYQLPKNELAGELVLYNMQGAEVKRYKVDNTFKDLLLNNTQLPAGTYFYLLQTSKGAVGTKKMVVVK